MSSPADNTAHKQENGRPFEPGQSGNPAGRPKGARNKLSEVFLQALAEDFDANIGLYVRFDGSGTPLADRKRKGRCEPNPSPGASAKALRPFVLIAAEKWVQAGIRIFLPSVAIYSG
jgi:hypothetical protein